MSAIEDAIYRIRYHENIDGMMSAENLARLMEKELAQLRNRIKELEKESKEHPYHESCPKCLKTKMVLIKRIDAEIDVKLKLRTRIAELEAEREWQPIETAPKDGTEIRLYDKTYDICMGSWKYMSYDELGGIYEPNCQWWESHGYKLRPTLWMPLPEPPEVE